MSSNTILHRYIGVGIFLLTLGVYIKTMAPAVSFWDCGEFIATSYLLGVPHPPGSPLYVLLGRVFSLFPIADVAARVTFMSALSSALAIWCVYCSTLALARRALGGNPLIPFGDRRDVGPLSGAVLASLLLAFSYTQWFNATEAEVYGYSIFFTCAGLWLILYWESSGHHHASDRWLLFIAYLFGLGGGLHLLCLLTIPTIAILAWFADNKLRRLIIQLIAFAAGAVISIALLGPGSVSNLVILSGLAALLYHLYGTDRRACYLLLGVLVLFALGYSTYLALYIRSGLNPAIDENDPETWKAFLSFVNREQYGTESMLLSMLTPRADRAYQFWDQQMKYFFQQFPFPFLEQVTVFRKATSPEPHPVSISWIPYSLGLVGLLWQRKRDWRRFLAILALFVVMGFGLSFYLNMPDPQPRERHYVFGGMYLAYALWIGLGWTAIIEWMRPRLERFHGGILIALSAIALLLPLGTAVKLYDIEDRTGDYIAYDYAHNILETCEPNSILFTNGDNDTFPLWYMQEVEGLRRDVRVVNLSLLNTGWYMKQLRDREPKIDIKINDEYIDSVLTDTQMVDLYHRLWREPKVPTEYKKLGLQVEVDSQPGHDLLRIQDLMVIGITYWNQWKRPLHFAITIPHMNHVGLTPYMKMMGMTMKVIPTIEPTSDISTLEQNLFETYQFRSLTDERVYKDENSERLLGNYRACVLHLADRYHQEERTDKISGLFKWAEENIYMGWEGYYTAADFLSQIDQHLDAGYHLMKAGELLAREYEVEPVASYENILAISGALLNPPYTQPEKALNLIETLIGLQPNRPEAYYELAASLQALGNTDSALMRLQQYRAMFGNNDTLIEAETILQQSINSSKNNATTSETGQ
ncbi:MAG: hypothetical protein CME10_07790 [Gemmatimonadetes bacterium]|nr:hypothetical protein [Gemmatimonadota bacterium]